MGGTNILSKSKFNFLNGIKCLILTLYLILLSYNLSVNW